MPNVAEILKDHVTLEVRCLDRLYRNAYVPRLQTPGGVSGCLVRACHQQIASPARFGQLTTAFKTRLRARATERDIPWIAFHNGKAVYVNHYYFCLLDPEWGPAFIKVCGYAPYAIKIGLNGHEWAKRQLTRQRRRFTALDNGFLRCADPTAVAARRPRSRPSSPGGRLSSLPLTVAHRTAGFTYQLSILQMEVSVTQVFARPLRGREFFEAVIRENLDLG